MWLIIIGLIAVGLLSLAFWLRNQGIEVYWYEVLTVVVVPPLLLFFSIMGLILLVEEVGILPWRRRHAAS